MATDAQIMLELFFAVYFALIIDRSHAAYNPYDTYSAWTRHSPRHTAVSRLPSSSCSSCPSSISHSPTW